MDLGLSQAQGLIKLEFKPVSVAYKLLRSEHFSRTGLRSVVGLSQLLLRIVFLLRL